MFNQQPANYLTIAEPDIVVGQVYSDHRVESIIQDGVTTNSILFSAFNIITGEKAVLKCIKKEVMGSKCVKEIENILSFQHENLMTGYLPFEKERFHCFFMPYADSGDLLNYILDVGSLDEQYVQAFACQMISAVHYMHSIGIMHGDIKPENFLLKSDYSTPLVRYKIILADFGYSRRLSYGEKAHENMGTKDYYAPEMFQTPLEYDFATDIYALGNCLFIMLTGRKPFNSEEDQKTGNYQAYLLDGLSDGAKDVIENCFIVDPGRRITSEDLMHHPWINYKPKPYPDSDPDPDPDPYPYTYPSL